MMMFCHHQLGVDFYNQACGAACVCVLVTGLASLVYTQHNTPAIVTFKYKVARIKFDF